MSGLADDDHPQYLLTQGVRQSINGFAVTGTVGIGNIPVSGHGSRLMWYSKKAAVRAGHSIGTSWDDANVGLISTGLGYGGTASGDYSVAAGSVTRASGLAAVALGNHTTASGGSSTALGSGTTASGTYAFASGLDAVASGYASTAMGHHASTNGQRGSFVYGDNSSFDTIKATRSNQFVVRAQHFWLGKTGAVGNPSGHFLTTSTGAYLSNGGTWTNSSDVNRKHAFRGIDGDTVLQKLAGLPIRTWSYRDEAGSVRHLGPTAQDFRAAFGLGDSEKAIATLDADGVSLAAIQELARRTADQARRLAAVEAVNDSLREQMRALEARR